jgi:hypothetical protein
LKRYGYAAGNPVRWSDPSGNSIFAQVGQIYQNHIKRAYLAAKKILADFATGFVAGGAGYIVGIIAYAALRTVIEYPLEQVISSLCSQRANRPICSIKHDYPSASVKFKDILAFAFNFADLLLASIYGGVLNVFSSRYVEIHRPNLDTLTGQALSDLQGIIRLSLVGAGSLTWVTQAITWGVITENDLIEIITTLTTYSTAGVAGFANVLVLDLPPGWPGVIVATAANVFVTSLTRTGYIGSSYEFNKKVLDAIELG